MVDLSPTWSTQVSNFVVGSDKFLDVSGRRRRCFVVVMVVQVGVLLCSTSQLDGWIGWFYHFGRRRQVGRKSPRGMSL